MVSKITLLALVVFSLLAGVLALWHLSETALFVVLVLLSFFGGFLYLWIFWLFRKRFFVDPLPKKWPNVSIIIPAFNEEKTVGQTIQSAKFLDYDGKKEIIVIDDGSSDKTYAIAKRFSGIRVFKKENGGKASALNLGITKSKHDLIVTLDADSFPESDSLRRMTGYFDDPTIAAVSSCTLVKSPKSFWQKLQSVEYVFANFLRKLNSFIDAQYVTPGPLSVFRKKRLLEAGGFDGKALTEDIDMALNLLSRKHRIAHSMNAVCYTKAPEKFSGMFRQRERWFRGGIMCTRKYLNLFFNREYNYLGFFVFPFGFVVNAVLLVFFLAKGLWILASGAWNFLASTLTAFRLGALDWRFLFGPRPSFLGLVSLETLFFAVLLGFSVFYLALVFKKSNQPFNAYRWPLFLLFLFYWGFLMGVLWVWSFSKEVLGVKRQW